MATDQNEALVLTNSAGDIYAFPRELVDRHLVTGEQKAQIQGLIGDDVSGYTTRSGRGPEAAGPVVDAIGSNRGPQADAMSTDANTHASGAEMLSGTFVVLPMGFRF